MSGSHIHHMHSGCLARLCRVAARSQVFQQRAQASTGLLGAFCVRMNWTNWKTLEPTSTKMRKPAAVRHARQAGGNATHVGLFTHPLPASPEGVPASWAAQQLSLF